MKKSLLSEETKRMQHLAGIISESSATQNTNTEEILSENIFQRISDKIKGAAIDVKSFLTGEEDKTAIFKNSMQAVEFPIGKNVYGLDETKSEVKLYRIKIKSINYKTGEADVSVEEKIKGLKDSWVKNDKSAKETEEAIKKDREKLENTKTEEEVKKWAEKFVRVNGSIKKDFEKGNIAFKEKDVKGIEDFYKKEEEKETAKELNESKRMKQLAGIITEGENIIQERDADNAGMFTGWGDPSLGLGNDVTTEPANLSLRSKADAGKTSLSYDVLLKSKDGSKNAKIFATVGDEAKLNYRANGLEDEVVETWLDDKKEHIQRYFKSVIDNFSKEELGQKFHVGIGYEDEVTDEDIKSITDGISKLASVKVGKV